MNMESLAVPSALVQGVGAHRYVEKKPDAQLPPSLRSLSRPDFVLATSQGLPSRHDALANANCQSLNICLYHHLPAETYGGSLWPLWGGLDFKARVMHVHL